MGRFTTVKADFFNSLQFDAGVLVVNIDPTNLYGSFSRDKIIATTTGGITVSVSREFSDLGEDIDNIPNNTKELKHLDNTDCTVEYTNIDFSPSGLQLSIGSTDIEAETGYTKVIPRGELKQSDFMDTIYWIGDLANGGAGLVALHNVLSDEGIEITTGKNEKGQIKVTLRGHFSINNPKKVPMELYVYEPEPGSNTTTETFTGDGSKQTFTLTNTPVTVTSVTVDGVTQNTPADYSVSGNDVIFSTAPGSGEDIIVSYTY